MLRNKHQPNTPYLIILIQITATMASPACFDKHGSSSNSWIDAYGYTCIYYADNGLCAAYGNADFLFNDGLVANQACCACGGGNQCIDQVLPGGSPFQDSSGFSCAAYVSATEDRCALYGEGSANEGVVANQACCQCGGGHICTDYTQSDGQQWWSSIYGMQLTCSSLGQFGIDYMCNDWGNQPGAPWMKMNQACCICGGGHYVTATDLVPAPTPIPTTTGGVFGITTGEPCVLDGQYCVTSPAFPSHYGVNEKCTIVTTTDGSLTATNWEMGYGASLMIQHGGSITLYSDTTIVQ